jgi:predicted DNA-binding protein (MmcQ/YjbR family)
MSGGRRETVAHPRMYQESNELIKRLREICLAFPAAVEKEAWGECTFRVGRGKMFAMTDNNHHRSGHVAVWVKAPPTVQETLVRSTPARFFKPPYLGAKGWVGVRLDSMVDWDELAAIVRDGYLMSAPVEIARPKEAGPSESTVRSGVVEPGTEPRKIPSGRPSKSVVAQLYRRLQV